MVEKLINTTVSVGKGTTELGIPFSKAYYRPTPKFWRKLGDNLLLIGSTITGVSAFTLPPWVTAVASGLTLLGKIITNCFKDDVEAKKLCK